MGILTSTTLDVFGLEDIRLHGHVEHDTSISRADFFWDDAHSFNEAVYQALVDQNPGLNYYNSTAVGLMQKRRLAESRATNPDNINTSKEFFIRSQEAALFLSIMGDPLTGVAPKKSVNVFFREERLQIKEGWTRPETTTTPDTLTPIRTDIVANSDWTSNNVTQCSQIAFVGDAQGTVFFLF